MIEAVSSRGRNPKLTASGEEPSIINAVPFFTLLCQSAAAPVPGGATKISAAPAGPGTWPAEERTAGHDPVCVPSTAKVPPQHAGGRSRAAMLLRKRVPHPHPKVVEIGPPRIAFVP